LNIPVHGRAHMSILRRLNPAIGLTLLAPQRDVASNLFSGSATSSRVRIRDGRVLTAIEMGKSVSSGNYGETGVGTTTQPSWSA
jgi:hypothetical protein